VECLQAFGERGRAPETERVVPGSLIALGLAAGPAASLESFIRRKHDPIDLTKLNLDSDGAFPYR